MVDVARSAANRTVPYTNYDPETLDGFPLKNVRLWNPFLSVGKWSIQFGAIEFIERSRQACLS